MSERRGSAPPPAGLLEQSRLYVSRQAASPGRYMLEQVVQAATGWVPTILGVGLRAIAYRLILRMEGWAAIEKSVRLRWASDPVPTCSSTRSSSSACSSRGSP